MTFTVRTITHQFNNADGTPASGNVRFLLSNRMTNGGTSLMPSAEITATLSGAGALSVSVPANDDTATTPTGTSWHVVISISGCSPEEYDIVVPSLGSGNVDLGSLLPTASQVG